MGIDLLSSKQAKVCHSYHLCVENPYQAPTQGRETELKMLFLLGTSHPIPPALTLLSTL